MHESIDINQLATKFDLSPKKIKLYINQIEGDSDLILEKKEDEYILSKQAINYFSELKDYKLESKDKTLLNYTLCRQIKELATQENSNFILQLTKRTKLKQQKEEEKFEKLPKLVQLEKENLAQKILNWLKSKFVITDLNKIIIDRINNGDNNSEKNPDLRITLYEGNHPQDINLIIKEELNYLKKIGYEELENKIKIETKSLTELETKLNNIDDEPLVKRLFKSLVGYKNYYKIATNPEMIVIDFSHIQLPEQLKATINNDCLLLSFDNDCKITICNNNNDLITKLKHGPQELEMFSL